MNEKVSSTYNETLPELVLPGAARQSRAHRSSYRLAVGIQSISLVLDIIAIFLTFWISYELRYTYRIGALVPVGRDTLEFSQWARHALAAIIFTVVVFFARGIYQASRKMTWGDYVPLVVSSYGIAIAGVILFAFFIQFSPSRAIYLYALVIGTVLMLGHRLVSHVIRTRLFMRGIGVDRALIVGETENARRLAQSLLGQSQWGYQLAGFISDREDLPRINVATEEGIRWTDRLGNVVSLPDVVDQHAIDEVFIIEADHPTDSIDDMIENCRSMGVQFRVVPELLQISMDRVDISEINGVPLIGVRDASIRGWSAALKRGADILLSIVAIIVLLVPTGIVALLIRKDSDGPIFYKQFRIGQHGQPFWMVKFRTMYVDADELRGQVMENFDGDSRLFKDRNDPRITPSGTWLRRYSIDELPQIWNVLKGDMSFVGPRPPLPREVAEYQPWHQQRLLVRPGMTGLWQVSGRSDLSFDQMVRLDLYYAENWSPWLDIKIILRTIPAVVFGRGAY